MNVPMKPTRLLTAAVATAALSLTGLATANSTTNTLGVAMTTDAHSAPLSPREALFGNPTKAQGRLSPDGAWLSWLAPKDGVLNIWLAPRANPAEARAITSATDRP